MMVVMCDDRGGCDDGGVHVRWYSDSDRFGSTAYVVVEVHGGGDGVMGIMVLVMCDGDSGGGGGGSNDGVSGV